MRDGSAPIRDGGREERVVDARRIQVVVPGDREQWDAGQQAVERAEELPVELGDPTVAVGEVAEMDEECRVVVANPARGLYRVRVGPFAKRAEAEQIAGRLAREGYSSPSVQAR